MSRNLKSLSVVRRYYLPDDQGNEKTPLQEVIVSQILYHPEFEKPISEIHFSPEGEPEHIVNYQYDDQGFMIREENREGDQTISSQRTFEPDEKGRIGREYLHYADGSRDMVSYRYDEKGRLLQKVTTDEEGQEESREIFEYENELLLREALVEGEGFLVREKIMEYDSEGLLDEIIIRDFIEGSEVRKHYDYDEHNRRRGYVIFNENDEPVERVLFDYDDQGRLVQIVDETRRQKNTTHMQYNGKGEVVRQEEFDMNGGLISRIERSFEPGGRLVQSKVFTSSQGHSEGQWYIMRHEYSWYDEAE